MPRAGHGPTRVITDKGVLEPDPANGELILTATHPGVDVADVRDATGWPLRLAGTITETEQVTELELSTLRELHRHTAEARGR